jgi:hypothetical protein
MVGDREARQPGGEFESTEDLCKERITSVADTYSDVLEDHRVGVHQVLNIGTDRRPRKYV